MSQLPQSELSGILFQEIEGYLPKIREGLSLLQESPSATNHHILNEVYRLFHNIKGAASQVAYTGLSNSSAICEELIAVILESNDQPSATQLEFLANVHDEISHFCQLEDKTPLTEKSLFEATVSYYNELTALASDENPITLPEYITTLLKTVENTSLHTTPKTAELNSGLQELRVDCLNSLRSIVPLLQELTDCTRQSQQQHVLPANILQSIMTALATLSHCSRAAGLTSQEKLLSHFADLLKTFNKSPGLPAGTIPLFFQEFLSYLDLIFSLPPTESEQVITTVQNHFARVMDRLTIQSASPGFSTRGDDTDNSIFEDNLREESVEFDIGFEGDLFTHDADDSANTAFSDDEEAELRAIFQEECNEHLHVISRELEGLEIEEHNSTVDFTDELRDSISQMRISVHTLKGAAAMTGYSHIATSAYALEQLLNWLREDSPNLTRSDLSIIHKAIDVLDKLSIHVGQSSGYQGDEISRELQEHLLQRSESVIADINQESDSTDELVFDWDETDSNLSSEISPALTDIASESLDISEELSINFLEEFNEEHLNVELSAENDLQEFDLADGQALQDEENELLVIFQTECDEHLQDINKELNNLAAAVTTTQDISPKLHQSVARMRRGVHTLKGAAAMTGFDHIASCAHAVEDLLDWLHDDASDIHPADISLIAEAVDTIETLSQSSQKTFTGDDQLTATIQHHLRSRSIVEQELAIEEETASAVDVAQPENILAEAEQSTLPVETGSVRVKLNDLEELVNIEGELVVARGSIEKLLDRFSDSLHALSTIKDSLRRKSQELEVGFEAQSLYGFGPGSPPVQSDTVSEASSESSEFDPIELDRYSQLNLIIRSLNEISIDVNAVHGEMMALGTSLQGQVARQQLSMGLMQEKLLRIRMTPLSSISRTLFRTVRQTAKRLGKDVQLYITGEDVLMDRFIWTKTIDPLMHILRNAIDHGIEDQATRIAQGKPTTASITLDAVQRGRMVVLRISDNGQGVNTKKLREKLIEENILTASTTISDKDLLPYLFRPSVSTRDDISQISGRGVGLDVVLRNIQELRGNVQIINTPGKGVIFELNIPVTLSVNRAIIIELGSQQFAVPIQDITEVRKFKSEEIIVGDKPQVKWNDKEIPVVRLAPFLNAAKNLDIELNDNLITLVVEHGNKHIAMQIDRVEDQREVIIKDLGSHLRYVKGISGVTLTGEGTIIPIVNLIELATVETPASQPVAPAESTSVKSDRTLPLNVLVVDDSISVRYSVTRLVQAQAWQAHQAVDGIDALEKLETMRPDVIILDIEMPRMNGYEFMGVLRNSKENANIPVVMLTSRASEKHRKKAEELGVNHYMTKPFQEDDFIKLLAEFDANR